MFPAIDFSLASTESIKTINFFSFASHFLIFYMQIETDEDVLWKPDIREEDQDIATRGVKFFNW